MTIFTYRRLRWYLRRLTKTMKRPPGWMAGIRNGTGLLVLLLASGMLLLIGLFFQSYHRFNFEKPVAEIITQKKGTLDKHSPTGTQIQYRSLPSGRTRYFFVNGDQWMIEGDILKWRPWLTFLGLNTRYRLTRISSRYLDIEKERSAPRTLISLNENINRAHVHPLWRWLYRSGHQLPLVDTVYGNAAYQNLSYTSHYLVFVSHTGFIVRRKG